MSASENLSKCSGLLLRSSFAILAARTRHLISVARMAAFSVASRLSKPPTAFRAGTRAARGALYRVPGIVTRGRFPDGGESDSTWRTQEARHVGSDTVAPGF